MHGAHGVERSTRLPLRGISPEGFFFARLPSPNVLADAQARSDRRMDRGRLRRARRWRGRRPHLPSHCCARGLAVDVDPDLLLPQGPHADARLRADARGRDGGVP
jgi:hypothetical protein